MTFDGWTAAIRWAGFWVACAAAMLSYLPRRAQTAIAEDWAVLTQAMLASKDHGYDKAMASFRRGGSVFYDGIGLATRPGNELSLTAVASLPAAEMDEGRAIQDADRARAALEALARSAPEVAAAAAERRLCIWLLSEYGPQGVAICRVADGEVVWKAKRA